jgi:hypothetical protein
MSVCVCMNVRECLYVRVFVCKREKDREKLSKIDVNSKM